MPNVAVVTDSTACIPEPLLESLQISIVPYYIHRGEQVDRDLVTLQRDEIYRWLPTAADLPTTACPGPGDYLETFNHLSEAGSREIISIHMTSKGSGAYQSALAAKTMLAERDQQTYITVIDTHNVAMCLGWIAIEAARAAQNGLNLEGILALISSLIPRVRMLQTADTLKYLYMGGRIGRARHLVGSVLNIKPIISMEDGLIVSLGTARSRPRVYERMVDLLEDRAGKMGRIKIAYLHAAAPEEAEKLQKQVEARLVVVETIFTELSPALGVHTGPGTAGFCYYPVSG